MTKKDFELIADVIADFPENIRHAMAAVFADRLAATNPLFDTEKFIRRATRN